MKPLPSEVFTLRGANAETDCAAAPWTSATLFDAVVRHRVTVVRPGAPDGRPRARGRPSSTAPAGAGDVT
ncbi:hypothetical protein CU044_1949 [Streptomyces sp. L-9-10]|nr:hypothetical protein CU044_1949 [Streptomyces sp. L-9-10]